MSTASAQISKAKTTIILDQPFFASILLALRISEEPMIPTMATDGKSILYNPEWVESLSHKELVFVLCHEVLHSVFLHTMRRGDRNHFRWNVAGDHVINNILQEDGIGTMPIGGLCDGDLIEKGGGTTEGVYDQLPKDMEEIDPGEVGGPLDEVRDFSDSKSEAEQAMAEADMKIKIIQAKNAAEACGKYGRHLSRLIDTITTTKTDWRSVLKRFLNERTKIDLSYARPKRRFLADDIYLPSLTGESLGHIVVAVDCSGSISQETLNYFSRELNTILETARPQRITAIYFDHEVSHVEELNIEAPIKLEIHGGGGTAFSPVFRKIAEMAIEPVACIFLTDLCCSDFGDEPQYPVIWASTDENEAPFGEVVYLEED